MPPPAPPNSQGATATDSSDAMDISPVKRSSSTATANSQMDTSSASPPPSSSKEATKSPTPGPFSALLIPLDRGASVASSADFDSGIEGMEGVEEGAAKVLPPLTKSASSSVNPVAACFTSLQNIFAVRLSGASAAPPPDVMELPDVNLSLEESGRGPEDVPDFAEVASDIVTEIMMGMANGTLV